MIAKLIAFLIDKVRVQLPKWFSTWKLDIFIFPVGVMLVILAAKVIRWYDPTAGIFDMGILQTIPVSFIKMTSYWTLTWALIYFFLKSTVWVYFDDPNWFEADFRMLNQFQRVMICLGILFGLLLLFAYFDHLS